MTFKNIILLLTSILSVTPHLYTMAKDSTELQPVLSKFEQYAEKALHDWQVPGMAVAIVQGDKVIYSKGFGVKKIGTQNPIDSDTIFQIGSISKSFTTALTGILVDQKLLKWKDKVIDYYPEMMLYDANVRPEFMIQDLFAQNSGLPTMATLFESFLGYSVDHMLKTLRYIKPVASFRSEYAYQNIFFVMAEKVLFAITQKDWLNLMNENILHPLDMKNSSATLEGFENSPNVTSLHYKKNGKTFVREPRAEGYDFLYTARASGGINSSVNDMSHYLIMLLNQGKYNNKTIISKENLNYLWAPKTIIQELNGFWIFYGLGWYRVEQENSNMIWHDGETLGCQNIIALIPEKKIGIVVLTNSVWTRLPHAIAYQFLDMYTNRPNQDWSNKLLAMKQEEHTKAMQTKQEEEAAIIASTQNLKSDLLPASVYVGTYHNDVYGKIEVKADNNKLYIVIGPRQRRIDLEHVFRDIFRINWDTVSESITTENDKAYFTLNSTGSATKIYIEFFKNDGNGIFTKVDINNK